MFCLVCLSAMTTEMKRTQVLICMRFRYLFIFNLAKILIKNNSELSSNLISLTRTSKRARAPRTRFAQWKEMKNRTQVFWGIFFNLDWPVSLVWIKTKDMF